MRNKGRHTGFTLIELLVTIAIAAIVSGIAIPSFNTTISSNRLTTRANELVTALNLARSEAIKRGQPIVVRKTGTEWENGWQVFVDVSRTGANANVFNDNGDTVLCEASVDDCLLKVYDPLQASYTLRGNNNFTNFVRYDADGTSNNIGSFVICDNADGNNIPEANKSRLIIINSVGRIRMGIDADHDGIPQKEDGTEITSCIAGF